MIRVDAARDEGRVTLDLLDHHFVKLTAITLNAAKGRTEIPLPATARPVESLRVHVGAFTARVDLDLQGHVEHAFAVH